MSDNLNLKNINQQVEGWLNKYFKWVVGAMVVIVLISGYYMVIEDKYFTLRQAQTINLVELDRQIADLDSRRLSMVNQIDRSVTFTATEKELLALALPKEFNISSVVIQLDSMVRRHNFIIQDVAVNSAVNSKDNRQGAMVVNLDLIVSGPDYENFKNLLEAMENSIMVFDVQSLSMTSSDSQSQYSINLNTYYYPEN